MEGNGPTRREFDALERRLDRLDNIGSRKTGELEIQLKALAEDVRALDTTLTWLVRSIAAIVFIAAGAAIIAVLSGLSSG